MKGETPTRTVVYEAMDGEWYINARYMMNLDHPRDWGVVAIKVVHQETQHDIMNVIGGAQWNIIAADMPMLEQIWAHGRNDVREKDTRCDGKPHVCIVPPVSAAD